MLTFDKSFRIIGHPKDEELQDYCDGVKNSMLGILGNSEHHVGTVVLCAHNEELYLPGTLASIARIATREKVRVLVVDNNSSDRTSMIAKECGAEVIEERKKGISYARQCGLDNASGEFIFSTDADVRVPPTWIDGSLKYFTHMPQLVGISGWFSQKMHPLHTFLRLFPKTIRTIAGTSNNYNQRFSGANTIYKRNAGLEAGGYLAGFDAGEDCLFGDKLSKIGAVMVIPDDSHLSVEVSPRRVDTATKVIKLYMSGFSSFGWLNRGHETHKPQTFVDFR